MYYKNMTAMPRLSDELKQECLSEAKRIFLEEQQNRVLYHRRFETKNEGTINHMQEADMPFYDQSGGVSAMAMSPELEEKVTDYFKQANHAITNLFEYYGFLFVEGGPYCAPHLDDVQRRRNGFQYLLQSGGQDTKTVWYKPKQSYADLEIIDYCAIPYTKIEPQAEAVLAEDNWYWMSFDSIHSVENLESMRIFLVGGIDGVGDMRFLLDQE
jgi:hypothetical protein